jgi:hypothetical protein
METAVSRKKRMILTARELEAQRAAGPASSRGFLRSLVASVTRPAQRSAADTLAALTAEVRRVVYTICILTGALVCHSGLLVGVEILTN